MSETDKTVASVLRAYAKGLVGSTDQIGGAKGSAFNAGVVASAYMLIAGAEALEAGTKTIEELIVESPPCGRDISAIGLKAEVDEAAGRHERGGLN